MPSKSFNYKTVIGVVVDSRGTVTGTQEVEKQLTRTEKRALKMIATIQKAFDTLNKSGFDSAKAEAVSAKIIAADEKVLRAIRATEAQKVKLTEQTRREQIRTADLSARASERAAQAQIKAERGVMREAERSYQSRSKFAVDYAAKEERYSQARFRSAQMLYREYERQQAAESRRTNQLQKAQERATSKRIENVNTIGGGLQSAGLVATSIATAPVVAGFYAAIKAGSEYEQSMNMLQAVTSATAEEMQRADELAIKLGNDIRLPGVSAKDAAEAMTELGKAGMSVSEAMDAAQGTLQLSTAANISAAQAAEITANALNMFKLRASEAGRVADLLAGAANASSAEITDVATSLQQAGSVFAAANVPIEDVVTLIAELANQGIKGSDAGTSLKTMMQRLQSPTDAAASTLKALNVEIFDSQGKMKTMREIIAQFEKSLGSLNEQQKAQALNTIFGSDAVRAANIVFGEGVAGFDKLSEAVQRANAAADLAQARTKGLAGAWEALKSQAETVGLIIYNRIKQPLTEVVIYLATFASAVTEAFLNLPPSVQQGILIFTALVAAVGPVITVIGTLLVALASVAEAVVALGGLAVVSGVIAAIGVVLAGLTAGIGLAAAAVYGLVEAWQNGFGPIASVVAIGAAAILSALSPVLGIPVLIGAMLVTVYEIWQTNFGGLRDFAISIWNRIVELTGAAMTKVVALVNQIGGYLITWWNANYPMILEIVEKVNATIQATITAFLNSVSAFWEAHGQTILNVVGYIWNAVKEVVMFALQTVSDIITAALQAINGDWAGAWDSILVIIRRAAKLVVAAFVEMGMLIGKAVLAIALWLYDNWTAIQIKTGEIVAAGLKRIVLLFVGLPVILLGLIPRFIAAGVSIGSAIWQGIKDGLSGNSSAQTFGDFDINSVFAGTSNPLDAVKTGVDDLSKSISDLGKVTDGTKDKTTKFNKELAALDDLSKKSKKATEKVMGWRDLKSFANENGFFVTSTTGGKHNVGSKHYRGLAIDVRTNDKSAAEIAWFIEEARKAGIYVADERVRPKGQKEWGGPHLHLEDAKLRGLKRRGGRRGGASSADSLERFLGEESDRKTREWNDAETQKAIDWANAMREMPDDETIRAYNELLKNQARKKGERQETIDETKNRFKGFSSPATVSGEISERNPLSTREQRILNTDKDLKISERMKELDERRLYLADEITAKSVDYSLSLLEAQTDLEVERKLLEGRNLLFETANEFTRQQNDQIRELGDVERDLAVLRQQNSDDQFVEQRRLLAAKREQIGLEKSIADLQDDIANVGVNSALRYKEAWLRAVYDIKDANIRAVESQIESQIRLADSMEVHSEQVRARVLEHLADQKTMSEAIADGIIDVYEKAGSFMDKILNRTGVSKIPILGDILKAKGRNFLSGLTQNVLDKFFPGMATELQKTGNPVADKIAESNKYLKQIAQNTGGGRGGLLGGAGGGTGGGKSLNFGDVLDWFGFNKNKSSSGGGVLASGEATGTIGAAANKKFSLKNLFGKGGIFGEQGFGNNQGTFDFFGSAAQMAGGAIGGIGGNMISMAGTGLSLGFQFGGPVGAAIGAGIGAIGGLIMGIFGRNKQRKADERARNQAILDAFSAIDKLIADVNSDKIDGASALSQADDIRSQYMSAMSQLKDKKARNHALADVSRIDSKIQSLKAAVSAQTLRKEKMAQLVPTFSKGGRIQEKPSGYIVGPGTARSDSILARISNGEYILDGETVKNIGVHHLDRIRSGKGRNIADVARQMKYVREPRFADGGYVGESMSASALSSSPSGGGGLNVEVKNNVVINGDGTATVKTEVFEIDTPQGKRKLMRTIEEEIYIERGQRGVSKAQIDVQNNRY